MDRVGLKVLLVGKGAREHALAWKLTQSPSVAHGFVVPGNGGTGRLPNVSNMSSVEANDYPGLVTLAKDLGIGLVVAGPDDAALDGIEGFFQESELLLSFFFFNPGFVLIDQLFPRWHSLFCSLKRSGRD